MKRGVKILLITVAVLIILISGAVAAMVLLAKKSEKEFEKLIAEGPPHVEFSGIPDGTYKGSYALFPVDVAVEVKVSGGRVSGVEILKHVNGRGGPAEAIAGEIIKEQSLEVDAVSGATFSSMVILKAVEDALSGAEQ